MQPPAPTASAAPVWDANIAKTAVPQSTTPQPQSAPPIPVSIPALPPSIPSVPDSIQGPAAPTSNPGGLPVPSFNQHSQAAPGPESAPGLAEVSASQPTPDVRIAQLAPPPLPSTSAPYTPQGTEGFQAVAAQPGYYAPAGQPAPNQPMNLQPAANLSAAYAADPRNAVASANPATAFAGSANTPASLNAPPTSVEPGVARLQGVIEKSTLRPSYDSSGSSLR